MTRTYLSSGILEGQFTQLSSSSLEFSTDYSNHSWTQGMNKRQMASHEDGILSQPDNFIPGEAVVHLALGSSHPQSSAPCPHQLTLHGISLGCFVLISHFLDSFIFPFGLMLSLETFDCALSKEPLTCIPSFQGSNPRKAAQATTLFSYLHFRHILKILFYTLSFSSLTG